MMNNDKNEEMASKMLASSLRVSLFGLQSMVSFMQPFMPPSPVKIIKEAKSSLQDKIEDSLP